VRLCRKISLLHRCVFTKWTWQFVQCISKECSAYSSHFSPKINQYVTYILPLLLANNTVLAFLFGDSMTCHSKLSLHFLVEALIICHKVSHCICNIQHVLHIHMCSSNTSLFHITHLLILVALMHTQVTALELFLLHKEFSHRTLANMCHWQPYIFIVHCRYSNEWHMHQTYIHTKETAHSWELCIKK
jgi:hypothetical protein